jgi:hypothetical protein
MTESEFEAFVEDRIKNWVRCVRVGLIRHHCGSAEHRYRPDRHEALEARRDPKIIIDEADGWKLESAWRTLALRHKMMLKFYYIHDCQQRSVIQAVIRYADYAIKRHHFRAEIRYAVSLFRRKALDMEISGPYKSDSNSTAAMSVPRCPKAGVARPEETEPVQA